MSCSQMAGEEQRSPGMEKGKQPKSKCLSSPAWLWRVICTREAILPLSITAGGLLSLVLGPQNVTVPPLPACCVQLAEAGWDLSKC